jgi:hypothetical protein
LVCGARDEDARAGGFDEGPKMPDWTLAATRPWLFSKSTLGVEV